MIILFDGSYYKEAERCDLLKGFLTLHSAAGGTGSGLGSFLTEKLADFYPSVSLLNAVVWPYQSGEVIVQNYNAMLTMASLADVAHGIFMLQNDAASLICQKLLRIPHPSFDAMNEVLATHLASSFLTVDAESGSRSCRTLDPLGEIRERLCQHPVRIPRNLLLLCLFDISCSHDFAVSCIRRSNF